MECILAEQHIEQPGKEKFCYTDRAFKLWSNTFFEYIFTEKKHRKQLV